MLELRRSRAPERIVLVLALVAAGALIAAAFAPGRDPDVEARASLASLAGEVEDAISAEWRRALRELPARLEHTGPRLRWGDAAPMLWAPASEPQSPAYAALAADARTERDPKYALELARAALEAARGVPARAASTLRVAQCARAAGDDAAAASAWRDVRGVIPVHVAEGEISAALSTFLVAADALDPIERERDAAELALAWSRGELALPVAADAGQIDARVELLGERLADAAGSESESVRTLVERGNARLRATASERDYGPLPARCDGTAWSLTPRSGELLASAASASGGCEGFLLPVTDAERVLANSAAPLLPEDFEVDIPGDGAGDALRPRTELVPGMLGFTLKHRDIQGWIAAGSARARWFSGGLGLLAALCAVAGVLGARALSRERHLAEMRAAFVAGVSHELRTPVASILLLAENLERGRVEGEEALARYHVLIRREALRLRRLVDGVLDFSRIERGRGVEVAREDVDVRAWLASVADEAREWARQHDVELDVAIGDVPESASIDREALRRAIWNLLENAQRHSGSRVIRLRAGTQAGMLVIDVEDEGRGIPIAQRAAIFEPFARFADAGTPGTGLGLALVREIARAHAGSILAEDGSTGRGARFRLRIPVTTEPEARK